MTKCASALSVIATVTQSLLARLASRSAPPPGAITRFVAKRIVTPFAPFVLSDAWLSDEIKDCKLERLNPQSVDLSSNRTPPKLENQVIFVQSDRLELFRDTVLDQISAPFILITGKWHLPAIELGDTTSAILRNPFLTAWFSQNAPAQSNIKPFPYGVGLDRAPTVWAAAQLHRVLGLRRKGIFVPYARVHDHLEGKVRETRERLAEVYRPTRKSHLSYIASILRHRYVISPAGDRPDTYRHWETIALGGILISDLPSHWQALFGAQMALVEDLTLSDPIQPLDQTYLRPNPRLASMRLWRRVLLQSGVSDARTAPKRHGFPENSE